MSSPERTIVVTILKIFNWNQPHASKLFDLSFFSLKTSSLILQKSIKASISQQEVHFNYSLKVAYQTDQNEIIIKLAHWQQNKNTMVEIADFTLNLDHLAHKKIQFFPFGKNDKVLKIAAGQPDKPQTHNNNRLSSKNNQQFIREKQDFLKRIGNQTSTSRLKADSSSVKSFSQQAMDLMAQIKSIKKHKHNHNHGSHLEQDFNDYYHQPNQYSHNVRSYRPMNKSNSASHLGVRGLNRPVPTPITTRLRGDQNSSNRSTRSQKHKLILNNLQMVACQNEYYQQLQSKPSRKSDLLGASSSVTKKRLFKSELY